MIIFINNSFSKNKNNGRHKKSKENNYRIREINKTINIYIFLFSKSPQKMITSSIT